MSVTIHYSSNDSTYPAPYDWTDTLSDVLTAWKNNGVSGTHPVNTGGFFGDNGLPSGLSGTTYGYTTNNGYAFSVYGDLSYDISTHILGGDITSISFGGGLAAGGKVNNPFLTITFDPEITNDTTVHNVVWGLMNADISALVSVLENDYGVDLTDTIAELGSPYPASTLVGVSEVEDVLLAA